MLIFPAGSEKRNNNFLINHTKNQKKAAFVAVLVFFLTFITLTLLPFINQTYADDIRDLDSIEALLNKIEKAKKEGLSICDAKKSLEKLKALGGGQN